ncbi:hypothetical protein E2493_10170 [Sphingomonas parva]|uniref:Putative Flp pilus-assembly TadG-like N-terminal domain-containing protein n=1 Tax=Sphingomonas parva TaxID=2555898 RepID=A0A4Y8ZQR3_9SPHN|nr:pilus assembly protein TadG-related protein [Sphingomonas parva]TFI58343.1 hypothetical protein E2493_10170 [Sphingomonas parva]
MKAWERLGSLLRSDRGNVLLIGAAAMPLLMASAGLAIDSIQLSFWKRQLQRAADSGAIAGAHALAQDAPADTALSNDLDEHLQLDLELNEKPVLKSHRIEDGSFAGNTFSPLKCGARGVPNCWQAARVTLVSERTVPFMSMFTRSSSTLRAEGTAALVGNGQFCMVSLYNGTDPGIIARGNPDLTLGCGIATNSRGTNAVDVGGAASVTANPVAAVGGITGGRWFKGNTTLQPYGSPVKDPFAKVPNPTVPSTCSTAPLVVPNGVTKTIEQGEQNCFAGADIKGTLIIKSDKFYVNNATLDIKGSVTGQNTTLMLMGTESGWTQNGGGKLTLTAPNSGDYKGIVVFRDRNAGNTAGKEIKLNGGADLNLTGAVYGPSTDFWIGGNTDISSNCIQLVGRKLEFKGGGNIQNNCPANSGASAFQMTVVRLVD